MRHLSPTSSTNTALGSSAPVSRHARVVRVNLAGRGGGGGGRATASRINLHHVDSHTTRPSSIGTGALTSSGSNSKLWRKQRNRLVLRSSGSMQSVYGRIFKLVFFLCLVLFLHALFGVGVPRIDSDEDGAADADADRSLRLSRIHAGNRTAPGKVGAFSGIARRQHHHLALDTDGHYTYAFAFEEGRAWARRMSASDRVAPRGPTEKDDPSNSPHAPPPEANRDPLPSSDEGTRQAHMTESEPVMEMDFPLFELGDPVHALRVHLPMTTTQSSPYARRGRRARARGQMLL